MHMFELRPVPDGFELRGGQLTETMVFCEAESRPTVHLVGFLSQKDGGELRIFNATGEVIVTRRYEAVIPMEGAVGGLHGPSNLKAGSAIHRNQL
jgi:hypothetical protein